MHQPPAEQYFCTPRFHTKKMPNNNAIMVHSNKPQSPCVGSTCSCSILIGTANRNLSGKKLVTAWSHSGMSATGISVPLNNEINSHLKCVSPLASSNQNALSVMRIEKHNCMR